MFAAAHRDSSLESLRAVMADERRAFGWSYPPGREGDEAERAFDRPAAVVDAPAV
jgi:hypothetical protein